MLLGGLYKRNTETQLYQFNVITTDPTEQISEFHHRMPVILDPNEARTWLESTNQDEIYALMEPTTLPLIIYACDPYVDNARHEGSQCMKASRAMY